MKFLLTLAGFALLLSCNKDKDHLNTVPSDPKPPQMHYIDLQNREVSSQQGQLVDINSDGQNDFLFATRSIGDPIEIVDKIRFSVFSGIYSSLFVGNQNNSPVLNEGDKINGQTKLPYEWFIVSEVELAEKVIGMDHPPFWRGDWKDVDHKFLAVQITKEGKLFHGWIELSIDKNNEKLILHKAAICKEENKEIKAGL